MAICLKASDVAAVAGMHRYKTSDDAIAPIVAKLRGGSSEAERVRASQSLPAMTAQETVHAARSVGVPLPPALTAARERVEAERESLAKANSAAAADPDSSSNAGHVEESKKRLREAEEAHRSVEKKCSSDLKVSLLKEVQGRALDVASGRRVGVDAPPVLTSCVPQQLRMATGTVEEESVLDRLKRQVPEFASAEPGRGFRTMKLGTVEDAVFDRMRSVRVTGMCDALTNDHIVEIKRRANRLFHSVPTYERIQLEVYLRLYGMDEGALAESYEEEEDVHWVSRDDELWDEVCGKVLENLKDALDADAPSQKNNDDGKKESNDE